MPEKTEQAQTNITEQNGFTRIVEFAEFSRLLTSPRPPLFSRLSNQVEHVRRLLENRPRKCQAILIEDHYVDRAFIDEFKEFYGSSFVRYNNYCTRLHFFTIEPETLSKKMAETLEELRSDANSLADYNLVCREFSDNFYLGYLVAKPLPDTRIGRTVIRHPRPDDAGTTVFPCTKFYTAHVMGLELSVCGLPFQQQDGGMSACASTAIWSSLNHYSHFENFQVPSPASITKLATRLFSPFGRSVPQENGLTVAQMGLAIEATGLSPYSVQFDGLSARGRKSILYSAIRSGFAPILIIKNTMGAFHAVTAGGMVLDKKMNYLLSNGIGLGEISTKLGAIYVNDDRIAPYHKASLVSRTGKALTLSFDPNNPEEEWELIQLLVPLHNKIRFAFVGLHEVAIRMAVTVGNFKKYWKIVDGADVGTGVNLEFWITKARVYRQNALFGKQKLEVAASEILNRSVNLPRYVGVIRISDKSFGVLDILVDTTNTTRHTNVLVVIGRKIDSVFSSKLVENLSIELGCPSIISKRPLIAISCSSPRAAGDEGCVG